MANRQYIGARYVPKFYQGSNGNEWESGVIYEALTMVTYLSNTYCSKKPVPARTITPNLDTEYWVLTAAYSSQTAKLREEFEDYKETVNENLGDINNILDVITEGYTMPELFGAKGDGVTDDTQAIKDAIDTGKPVIALKNYLITETIEFDASLNYSIIKFFGKITYSGTDACFKLLSKYVNLFINEIEGNGTNVGISFERTSSSNTISAHNILNVNRINNFNIGIRCKTDGTNGVQYNKIIFNEILNCTYGIKNELNSGWINSNYFIGGRIGPANYGIYVNLINGEFDGNMFNDIGLEGITQRAIVLDKSTSNYFKGLRIAEGFTGDYIFYLTDSSKNLFEGDIVVAISQITDTVTTPSPSTARLSTNCYKCKLITNTPNGTWLDTDMESYNNTFLLSSVNNQAYRGDQADIDFTSPGTYFGKYFRLLLGGSHTVKLPYLFDKDMKINVNPIGAYTLQTSDGTSLTLDLTTGGNNRTLEKIGDKYISIILGSTS